MKIPFQALVLGTRGKMVLSLPVPTDLADYFEAILAAVFLDSNSFETTWDVSHRSHDCYRTEIMKMVLYLFN